MEGLVAHSLIALEVVVCVNLGVHEWLTRAAGSPRGGDVKSACDEVRIDRRAVERECGRLVLCAGWRVLGLSFSECRSQGDSGAKLAWIAR